MHVIGHAGPELFGFNDEWVQSAIMESYPPGAHTLAKQVNIQGMLFCSTLLTTELQV